MDPERLKTISELTLQLAALLGTDKVDFAKIRENKALSKLMKMNSSAYRIVDEYCYFEDYKYEPEVYEEQIGQLGTGLPFDFITRMSDDFDRIFIEYSDIDFIAYPGKMLDTKNIKSGKSEIRYMYEFSTLSDFIKTDYWKMFEGKNAGKPISKAFARDPKLKNVYYPICWNLFAKIKKDADLRSCILAAAENMKNMPEFC